MEQLSFTEELIEKPEKAFYKNVVQILKSSDKQEMPLIYNETKAYSTISFGERTADIRVFFGKSSSYFAVKYRFKKKLDEMTIEYLPGSTNLWRRIDIDKPDEIMQYIDLINAIYDDRYLQNSPDSFDCCSRYMQCSDEKRCVNPYPNISKLCKYHSKIKKGIIFYGKNKNIK